jgi:hypothetical protein
MSLTKAQIRTAVRQYIDDPDATRWSNANLDVLIQVVYDGLFGDILQASAYWNSQYDQITAPLHAPGYIDLRKTTDGDLSKRLFKLQQVLADGRQYYAKDPRDFLLSSPTGVGGVSSVLATVEHEFTYELIGNQLWLHPLGSVTAFAELRYSYRPALFTALADGDAVEFPEGAEHVLILLCAAHALIKGGAEDAGQMLMLAEQARQRMFDTIVRRHGVLLPYTTDTPAEWGS